MRGVYHRAGPTGPASGRPDGRLRPDPVAYCALPLIFGRSGTMQHESLERQCTK